MKGSLKQAIFPILVACSLFVGVPKAKADSPLTSTPIANAYEDVDLVQEARINNLSENVLAALSDPNVPNDVRAAIINALGWSFEGQENAEFYLKYIARSRDQGLSELTIDELSPQETFSLGYLLAMDDYFNLSAIGGSSPLEQLDAIAVLRAALLKEPNSFSIALVNSLAQAQTLTNFPDGGCDVYQLVAAVNDNFVGDRNLRPEAVEIVIDYISLYKDYCGSEDVSI